MSKGSILKKRKALSLHSRAARRATSPGIDTDKSLKTVQAPRDSLNQRPAVLAAHHHSGVTKSTKKSRKSQPSARARKRQERSQNHAEAVMDRTAKKIDHSLAQARVMQARRKGWEEVNNRSSACGALAAKGSKGRRKTAEDEAVEEIYADTDEEMDGANDEMDRIDGEIQGPQVAGSAGAEESDVIAAQAAEPAETPTPLSAGSDGDDEIL